MECMAQEPVLFEDILCQLVDMIGPEVSPLFMFLLLWFCFYCSTVQHVVTVLCLQSEGYITLRDVKSSKLSGNVFNILFNLNKFIAFESRDPFLIRQVEASLRSYFTINEDLWQYLLVNSNDKEGTLLYRNVRIQI